MEDKNIAVLRSLESRNGAADAPVTIAAQLHAKSGLAGALKGKLIDLAIKTKKDGGCINYDLHQDIADESHFMFYERWESHSLWKKHVAAPYVQAFFDDAKNYLAVPIEIVFWDMLPPDAQRQGRP